MQFCDGGHESKTSCRGFDISTKETHVKRPQHASSIKMYTLPSKKISNCGCSLQGHSCTLKYSSKLTTIMSATSSTLMYNPESEPGPDPDADESWMDESRQSWLISSLESGQSRGWVTAVTKPTRMSNGGNMPGTTVPVPLLQDECQTPCRNSCPTRMLTRMSHDGTSRGTVTSSHGSHVDESRQSRTRRGWVTAGTSRAPGTATILLLHHYHIIILSLLHHYYTIITSFLHNHYFIVTHYYNFLIMSLLQIHYYVILTIPLIIITISLLHHF